MQLWFIIDKIERYPSPLSSLHKQHLQSLNEKVIFLQKFLEDYNSPFDYRDEADPLEVRIADAAYAAEDVIENEIVDRIRSPSTILGKTSNFFKLLIHSRDAGTGDDFNQDMHRVIEDMDMIKKEVAEMARDKAALEPQLQRNVSANAGGRNNVMVGFDDVLLQLMDRLTGGQPNRQIIPIVGMGGIGKTTLAENVFGNALIKEHFDVCVWATISQDYNVGETLAELLSQVRGNLRGKSENELGEELYKYLCGRRYLIVMDDMWSLEVWQNVKFFFPDNNSGSRILVTTRMSNLAVHLTDYSNSLLDMSFLDEVSSWNLFSKTVYGEESFPIELEQIGRKIVEKCNGLPLSIVVIGGLMAKSPQTLQYWQHIERNLSSVVNSENDEYCLRLLKMSYNNLPAYLKPCFLYMGIFEEDSAIRVSKLVKLWISEGFLKPLNNKRLETIAEEYLKELVDRNLVLVHKLGLLGNMKYCKIHDLLRDLSLKEAQKQRLYYVVRKNTPPEMNNWRRIVVPKRTVVDRNVLKSMSHARSYVCHSSFLKNLPDSRLLRTLNTCKAPSNKHSLVHVLRFVNSRYIDADVQRKSRFPTSVSQLWNLETLIISSWDYITAPTEIWKMPHLRHVEFKPSVLSLPKHPTGKDDDIVIMENLHTLKGVNNLNLNDDVVERIPNIKKLRINYTKELRNGVNCFSHLGCLESLHCSTEFVSDEYMQKISFPQSLKKLTLSVSICFEKLEDLFQKIGSLPLLQRFVLSGGIFKSRKWETIEGQFPILKLLTLSNCQLENWIMSDCSHFPLLRELRLLGVRGQTLEIPSEIGEIATLDSILVAHCSESVVLSAKRILEEQEDLHGEQLDLRVRAILDKEGEALQSLARPNFEVEVNELFLYLKV